MSPSALLLFAGIAGAPSPAAATPAPPISPPGQCLTIEGGTESNCDGTAPSFCAALGRVVSLDECTLESRRLVAAMRLAERQRAQTPEAKAERARYLQTPMGRVQHSAALLYGRPKIYRCLLTHENSVHVLEICKIDPKADYAVGAMDYVAKIRPAQPRYPGMTIGGSAAWATPWVNAHCRPMVVGYRCKWAGLELEYQ